MNFVAEMAGVPVIVSPGVAEDEPKVTLAATDISCRAVLRLFARQGHAGLTLQSGVAILSRSREFEIRIYDVGDLAPKPGAKDPSIDNFVDLVRSSVDPESWDSWEDARIATWSGLLLVSQSEETHRELQTFLAALRRAGK